MAKWIAKVRKKPHKLKRRCEEGIKAFTSFHEDEMEELIISLIKIIVVVILTFWLF